MSFSDLTSVILTFNWSVYFVCVTFIGISCHTMSYRTIWQPHLVKHRNSLDSIYNTSSLFPWQRSSDVQFKRSTECTYRWKEIRGKGMSILSCCVLSTNLRWRWWLICDLLYFCVSTENGDLLYDSDQHGQSLNRCSFTAVPSSLL